MLGGSPLTTGVTLRSPSALLPSQGLSVRINHVTRCEEKLDEVSDSVRRMSAVRRPENQDAVPGRLLSARPLQSDHSARYELDALR